MFSAIALQTNISAALITIIGIILAIFALGLHKVKRLSAQAKRGETLSGTVTIEGEDSLSLDRTAQRLLGVAPSEILTVNAFCEVVTEAPREAAETPSDITFASSLRALVSAGRRFEMMTESGSGALLAIKGAPDGSRAVLYLRAATDQELALAEEIAARRDAERQLETAYAIVEQRKSVALCLNSSRQVEWQSPAFDVLPPSAQGAVLRLARTPNESLPEAVAGEDMAAEDSVLSFNLADGQTMHLAPEVRSLSDGRMLWIGHDVTRATEADMAFRRFVHTMSDTFAHLKMSLMIFDRDRRLTLFNPATVEVTGMDAAWMAQRPTLKALLDRLREMRMTPEQANFIEWRDRVLKATAPDALESAGRATRTEEVWHLANGRTLHVLARPHPSGGLAVVIEDISDTMALRRQSVSDRAVHIATADVLKEAIVAFAPDGSARLSNAAFRSLWGMANDDAVLGQHVNDIVMLCKKRAPDPAFWQALVDCVTGQMRRSGMTTKLALVDGTVMSARISPVPDGGVLAVFSDITDSERIAAALTERNDALEQAKEMRATLIDQISHQMRTPLNSIYGFGQLLQEEHFGPLNEQQTQYVGGIIEASGELLNAISGMTDIIDMDEDPESAATNNASITRILHDVVGIVNARKGSECVRVVLPEPPLADAPKGAAAQQGHLRQIIFNLLTDTLTISTSATSNDEVAEVAIGVNAGKLIITCSRYDKTQRVTGTLAFAMASRLASILGGTVSLDMVGDTRVIRCELPLATVSSLDANAETQFGEHLDLSKVMPGSAGPN